MSAVDVMIRPTVADDLDSIAEIYAHHVLTGVATFELTPPDHDEWQSRFECSTRCSPIVPGQVFARSST